MNLSSVKSISPPPSPWVTRFGPLLRTACAAGGPGGTVLDLAAGGGRHVAFLRGLGLNVVAVDRTIDGLACFRDDAAVEIIEADLEAGTSGARLLSGRGFAGIVVTNYLYRPLFPALGAALSPGGVLIYETFADGNARYGKPANPDFLLRPGELLTAFAGHQIVAYEHGYVSTPRPAVVSRICAVAGEAIQPLDEANSSG